MNEARTNEHDCPTCGNPMERKCFKGGYPPIWRCKPCEYKEQDRLRERQRPSMTDETQPGISCDPLSIKCEWCGALPMQRCSEPEFGVYTMTFHNMRMADARKIDATRKEQQ